VSGSRVFLRISTKPAHASAWIHSAGASAPSGFLVGLGRVGLGWVEGIARLVSEYASCMPVASAEDASSMRGASVPQRTAAAFFAFATRSPRVAAQGLCSNQSWMLWMPSRPSRKPTSTRVPTSVFGSPDHPAAISMSSSDMPERSPSGRLSATHRNRQTRDQHPVAPRRRWSFTVFGCRGKAVEIRASSAMRFKRLGKLLKSAFQTCKVTHQTPQQDRLVVNRCQRCSRFQARPGLRDELGALENLLVCQHGLWPAIVSQLDR
jgi:hypothetical protein